MRRNPEFIARVRPALSTLLFTAPIVFAMELSAANVVTDWNTVASTTIVKNAGNGPGAAGVWFAYSSIAVYDAVNAITRPVSALLLHRRGTGARLHRRCRCCSRAPRSGQLLPLATGRSGCAVFHLPGEHYRRESRERRDSRRRSCGRSPD